MSGILTGFAVIGLLITVGYLCARYGVTGPGQVTQKALNKISFLIAIPALVFTVIAETPLRFLWGPVVAIQAIVAAAAAVLYLVGTRVIRAGQHSKADLIVGATASGYINSNNMGFPIAVFVLGNPQAVVPVLLLNLLIIAPIMLMLLDVVTSGKVSWKLILLQPVRNPLILASIIGAVVSATGWRVPQYLWEPLRTLGNAAIPMMLMAFGMSLVGAKPMQAGKAPRRAIVLAALIKSLIMPTLAFVLARFIFNLPPHGVFSSVIIAALPTAQNIYNYAARYGKGELLARDIILLTTAISPVTLIWAAAMLN
ncbi:MAG: AEC family transporter [Cellulomonadaceae bacterium]|jgi:predicted permease|nr:AEC family transporter [Cellulomonadaceae bacterium]